MLVRVFIPHYFQEVEGGTGYGSGQPGSRLARSLALARCISSLLNLQRDKTDVALNIGEQTIDYLPDPDSKPAKIPLKIQITICTDGQHQLDEIIKFYRAQISCVSIQLEDPKLLPLKTRDLLVNDPHPADLSLYLEDDLVITDPEYCDKLLWFAARTNNAMTLMPHRYERIDTKGIGIMLADGPLASRFIEKFMKPQKDVAIENYQSNRKISFDLASNPHSGTFALTNQQRSMLQAQELPYEGFVSPLETAATLTVLKFFQVLKPSFRDRDFLKIEHAHASFGNYINFFPHRQSREIDN